MNTLSPSVAANLDLKHGGGVSYQDSNRAHRLQLTFIDEPNYKRLQGVHFTLDDFTQVLEENAMKDRMALLTLAHIQFMNQRLTDLIFGKTWDVPRVALSSRETDYVEETVTEFLVQYGDEDCQPERPLCFDTVFIGNSNLLVVVKRGFLNYLAETKDNFKQFVLACIRCSDRFNCDKSQLNKLYLQLQLSDAPYELLRCRID